MSVQAHPGRVRDPLIALDGVSKTYYMLEGRETRAVEAVRNISLRVANHEFVSVVGPSGCGKSTLLLMTAGLVKVSRGRILINGMEVSAPFTELGIVFQQDLLLPWRSALDNILLQYEVRGLDLREGRERAERLLSQVGLEGFESVLPGMLSGGMRQRVAICRALVHDAPVLLMDEPFGALDALTRDQMNADLLRLWETDRKTVMFVTHSIEEAVFLSDRVVVMSAHPGEILQIVDIELDRPRGIEIRRDAQFRDYVDQIHTIFSLAGVLQSDGLGTNVLDGRERPT